MKESELMDLIFERPAMYLGHRSVVKMEAFISGYSFSNLVQRQQERDAVYEGFRVWIVEKYKVGQFSWSSVVSMIGISEEGGFEVAKELWDEYKQQPRQCKEIEGKSNVV